jgi:hypothetical protein
LLLGAILGAFFAVLIPQRGYAAGNPLPGQETFGFGGDNEEIIESLDTLFPLYAPKDGLFFFNPRVTFSNQADPRVSLGLGYRQLFEDPQVILGANVFYDNFDTVNNDRINQVGFGAEMLTRWVDLRANLYVPDRKRYKIDQTQTVSTSQTSSSSTQAMGSQITSQTLGFQAHNIVQTTEGVDVSRTINTSEEVQTTRFFDRYEAGMLGGDVEGGVLLPWLDRYADVRVFGGYYCFDNQFGKNVQGPESRLEVRALPAVTFDVMYYSNKEVIGAHWFFGVRVGVPFDLANMAEGRSPFAGFWDSFKPRTKEEQPVFARRITENVIRTSRVSTSTSKLVQAGTSNKVIQSSMTTQDTVTPFNRTTVLTLGGMPITVTHVNSVAGTAGNGTFETPYKSLTLADTDAIKRNILLLYAGSVFNGQSIHIVSGQQLFGDAKGLTHLINTDQLGTIALPHASTGTAPPILSNPGGTVITVANNVQVSGLNILNSARGIVGAPGASNVTISNSTFSNMTAAAVQIAPSINTTLNNLTFQNNFKDVILDAANTTITNVTSIGATNGSISLADNTGVTTLTNVSIRGAGVYGLSVTNPGGTHNITNLNIAGGSGDGVDIQGGAGVFAFDATSSIINTGGTGFSINGGASNVSFGGIIAGSATGHSVQVQNHTGGAVSFSGNVTDTGLGINLANNTGGSIVFSGASQTLNTGTNTALTLSANNGASISFSNLAISTTTGAGIAVTGANSSVTLAGTNNPGPGAPAFTFTNTSGSYDYSALTSSQSNVGLAFDNTQTGTYKLGSLTIANAPGAAAFSDNTSAANITLANLTVTNAAGIGLNLTGETGSFDVAGTTTITTPGTAAINLNTVTAPVNLGNVSVTNAPTAGLVMANSNVAVTAGTVTIDGATTGLQFGGNTGGSFTATGATNLTNITTTGIDADGAMGTYTFGALSIGFTGAVANTRGIDFRSSELQFQTGNLSITGNGTPTSIAIDLSGSLYPGGQPVTPNASNILLATAAGQTAAISNVETGVLLGDAVVGTAGAYLRYGNQTPITSGGSGSSVAVLSGGVTIDTANLTSINGFTQGRYEFTGVSFTGQATFEGPTTGFIFVGANATGNDTGTNPANRINVAQLLARDATPANLDNKTVVFVNDVNNDPINFSATTLTLGTGTTIDGFGNGHTVLVPSGQPANVIGDTFVAAGGSFTDPNGAATLTANPAVNVLTLGNGDTVQNININGGNNQIVGNGTVAFTLNGVVQTNAGASAINLTNATGTVAMTGGSISGAAGNAFVIDGGNAAVSYSGNITNAAAHSVVAESRTGGSVTLSGVIHDTGTGILVQNNTGGTTTFSGTGNALNTGANQAVTLTNNTGATTIFTGRNLTITTTSAIGFGASGGGTVGVTGTGNTITSGTGTALSLNGVALGGSGFVLQSVSANGATNGIALTNLTGGGTVGVQITGTGTTTASGGTIQNTTGAAVSLTSLGSLGGGVTLDNMNITGSGGVLGTNFGTLSVANDSVSATGAAALSLTTGAVAVGSSFSALSSSGSATSGISLDTITGGVNLGNVSVTNATTTGLVFVNSSAAVTAGTVTINGAPTGLQFGVNTGGSFTATGATSLTNITTTGIDANGATGNYSFNGLTISFTGAIANTRGIDFRSSDVQFQAGNLSITGNSTATSIAIDLSGSLYPGGQPVTPNAPNILLATAAGQTGVIGSMGTGVKLGDTTVGSAGAYLRYGNQTPDASGGSGSSIAVIPGGVTIDTSNLASTDGFTQGRYEFTGVTYTGLATFERTSNPNFIFVSETATGNGSGSDPSHTISVAQLLTLDGTPANLNNKTVVFVNANGDINFAATTLTLGTGTTIDGFGNGATVVVPNALQPANVIGDTFVLGGGTFTDSRGAANLTANAAVNVLNLGNGDTVQNININGGNNQIIGTGTAGFTLNGVVQTNANASAISLTNSTGTIAMTGGSISGAAGNSFVIDGGNSVVTYSGSITNTAGHSVLVQNRTGGSVTLSGTITDPGTGILVQNNTGGTTTFSGAGDTFNTGANQAVTLTNNTGATINFTGSNLTITTASGTGFGASGGGTVEMSGTGNTITSGVGTALNLNGVSIGTGFQLQSVSANGAVDGIVLNNLTGGGTVGFQVTGTGTTVGSGGTIQNTTGAAVSLTGLTSLGGGVTLNNLNITGGGGILGTSFGTLSVANDSVSATGAAALSLTTGTIKAGSTFSALSSSGSTSNGVSLNSITGGVNLGNVTVTNAATSGLVLVNSGAAVTAGTVTINGATTGLQFGVNTGGSFTATGATNLTNITTTGIDANGATGAYTFNGLSIGFAGAVANTRGIDFRSSDLLFQTGNLSITGNGAASSIAIDLSGSLYPGGQPVTANAPNILLATAAGQTAVISNVGTGVKLGDSTVGSAGTYLRYGNQTPIGSGGSGSSIAVISGGVTIDTTNLTSTTGFMQGRYEFTGVTYTGKATFEQAANPNFIFVGSISAGNDNGSNPSNRIDVAQLLTLDGTPSNLNNKTVVFVNDGSINFGATTLTLGTGTTIDGFGNGHTVVVPGGTQPVNIIGDTFVLGGGSFTDPAGAATLTANASVNVLTLSSGNTVQDVNINGGNNQIIGSGTAGFTLNGVVQTSAGASAINLTNSTGTVAMTGGRISGAAGNSLVIDGGNSVVSYSGNITNSAAHSVVVQNRTGGSVTLSGVINDTGTGVLVQNNTGGTTTFSGAGDTFNTGANQAVTLTNNTGAMTNFTGGNLAITTTSATGFGASGGGTVSVTGAGNTITSGTGTALSLNGVAIASSGFVLLSVSANGATNGIALNNLTGGGAVGVQVTGTGATANSGGTIQNTTGAAVSLTSIGSLGGGVTLNNMSITGGGGILGTNFGTLSVANDSVSATGAPALSLTTGTVAAGSTFGTLSSSGSASNGVLLSGVGGSFTANAGTISGATGAAWSVTGGTVGATYSGNITQANNAALVSVSGGHTGTLTFQTGTLSATNGTGLQFDNADGTYNFNGTATLNGGDAGIDILNGSSGTFAFSNNTSITNPTGSGFVANGSSANVTYSGNITKNDTSAGLLVDVTNESAGTITFQTGTLSSSSSAGTGINLSNADGTVNFNGTTTFNAGNAHVDINTGSGGTILFGSGASIGTTTSPTGVAFNEASSTANVTYNGTIRQTNAVNVVSVNGETGGTTTLGGAIAANTTTANGINLTNNTGATINFTGGGLVISTTTGVGFNATGGGTISLQGSGNSINSVSATAINVANTTIGANGLTFQSISSGNNTAAPEPVSGIILNTTGSSGGLTVTGDGNTSVGGDSSGGTIQHTTGVGIALTNTLSPSFTNMNIQSTARSGIAGTGVTNFTFNSGTVNQSGTQNADANIAFNSTSFTGAQTQNGNNISGTLTITGSVLSNGFAAGLDVQSDAGTVTNANVSNNSVSNTGVGTAGISFVGTGNASTSFSLDSATINQNTVTNAASGGIQISIGNSNATGPGATAGIPGNSADVVAITNNAVSLKTTGTNAIIVSNSGGNSASRTQTNFIISGNGRTAALGGSAPAALGSSSIGTVILIGNNGFSTMTGTVDHNVITANQTPNLGGGNGIAGGNGVAGAGSAWTPNLTLTVTNNTISGTDGNGILLVSRGTSGTAKLKIADNNVSAPVNAGGVAAEGIRVDAGNAASANDSVFLNIFGNTSAGSNGAGGIGLRKQGTNPAINVFGIFDSDTGLPNSPTNSDVVNFVNSLNPNGNGTDIINGSGFVRDTTQAPP